MMNDPIGNYPIHRFLQFCFLQKKMQRADKLISISALRWNVHGRTASTEGTRSSDGGLSEETHVLYDRTAKLIMTLG